MRSFLILTASLAALAACDRPKADIDPSAPMDATDVPASVAELDGQVEEAQDFVTSAAQAGLVEIRTSEMAVERAANADVKAFAQQMIDHHRGAVDSLSAAAGGAVLAPPPDVLDDFHMRRMNDLVETDGDADFDADYMALQVDAHDDAIRLYEAYAAGGDIAQLKTFAEEQLPALREHQTRAVQLRDAVKQSAP
ncbi:MAG: DUF4142 domain-containing protein [Alphaproteobacteria bacterium]|nr:DUF4142 domain-containing protein [Alphaproteobacteria bacterium]